MTASPAFRAQTSSPPEEEGEEAASGASRLGERGPGSKCGPGAVGFPGQPISGKSWGGG